MCVMRSVDVRPSDVRRQLGIEARLIELRLLAISSQSPPARGQNSCTIGKKYRVKL